MDETINSTQELTVLPATLRAIRKKKAFQVDWQKMLDGLDIDTEIKTPLPLLKILETNGIVDTIRVLRAVDKKYRNAVRLFACHCARKVLPIYENEFPNEERPRKAIEAAERYAHGEISQKELNEAHKAAWVATRASVKASDSFAAREAAYATRDCAAEEFNETWLAIDGAARAIVGSNDEDAFAAALGTFLREFRKLCKLEGKYREVVDTSQAQEDSDDEWDEHAEEQG